MMQISKQCRKYEVEARTYLLKHKMWSSYIYLNPYMFENHLKIQRSGRMCCLDFGFATQGFIRAIYLGEYFILM